AEPDRPDAADTLDRAGPRGKAQRREAEEGSGASRDSGRSAPVTRGRNPALRRRENRTESRSHRPRSGRESHASREEWGDAALEKAIPEGATRVPRASGPESHRVRLEDLDRRPGWNLSVRAGHDASLRGADVG